MNEVGPKEAPTIETEGVLLTPQLAEAETRSQVQTVFDNAGVQAARTIARIGAGETIVVGDKARFDAARYIVDRVLGSPAKAQGPASDPWKGLMKELNKTLEGSEAEDAGDPAPSGRDE
jgi:hypothetical protein